MSPIRSLLLAASLLLLTTGCLLEQRTAEPEDLPLGCRVDAECALGRICEDAFCVPGCHDDDDCPDAQVCAEDELCADPA